MTDSSSSIPTLESLRTHREEILHLAEQYGAYNVRVFGSVARGDAKPGSDIDLLVNWDYDRLPEWGGIGFELALEQLLGCHIDVVSEKWIYPPLREQILGEAASL